MQGRSWMAALTVAVGTVVPLALPARADDKPAPALHKVQMRLLVAGLGPKGCDAVVKPANGGCRFRPVSTHIDKEGKATVVLDDVQTTSADRTCAFAITIREPGHPERTVRRGLVLTSTEPTAVSRLECWVSSPSRVAQAESMNKRR